MPETETDAQIHSRDAIRSVDTLATHLETLAARLRLTAQQMERGDGNATRVAADIVDNFTQGVGGGGTRLWSIVRAASDADKAHARHAEADR